MAYNLLSSLSNYLCSPVDPAYNFDLLMSRVGGSEWIGPACWPTFTGTVDQEHLLRNEYLVAENRILKAKIKARLRLSDAERATRLKSVIGWSQGTGGSSCHGQTRHH